MEANKRRVSTTTTSPAVFSDFSVSLVIILAQMPNTLVRLKGFLNCYQIFIVVRRDAGQPLLKAKWFSSCSQIKPTTTIFVSQIVVLATTAPAFFLITSKATKVVVKK